MPDMSNTKYGPSQTGPRPNCNETKAPNLPIEPRPTIESQISELHRCADSLVGTIDSLNKVLSPLLWQDPNVLDKSKAVPGKSYPCVALDSLVQLEYKLVQINIRLMDINSSLAL